MCLLYLFKDVSGIHCGDGAMYFLCEPVLRLKLRMLCNCSVILIKPLCSDYKPALLVWQSVMDSVNAQSSRTVCTIIYAR